jgi:hypothetical protein
MLSAEEYKHKTQIYSQQYMHDSIQDTKSISRHKCN